MLDDLFPGSKHIAHIGLSGETPDRLIWEFAKTNGFAITTADADFLQLAETHGSPPQIIRLEKMDYSTEAAANLIRRYSIAIKEFERTARSVFLLRRT